MVRRFEPRGAGAADPEGRNAGRHQQHCHQDNNDGPLHDALRKRQPAVYVAARQPRSIFRSIAARLNRSIPCVPIGQLSPTKLKRIRVVHVLDGYERRAEAKDYIW